MRLGYKGRLAVLVLAQVGLLALVALLVYAPTVAANAELQKQFSDRSAKQAELCDLVEAHPDPEAGSAALAQGACTDIAAVQAEIRQLENRMPPESRISWVSAQIAHMMRTHHMDLRSATDWTEGGPDPGAPALKRLRKTLTVRCAARDLQALLEALNRLSFAVVVEDLDVRRDPKPGAVSADIHLATFVLRANAPRAGAGGTGE